MLAANDAIAQNVANTPQHDIGLHRRRRMSYIQDHQLQLFVGSDAE
jgi:hypothetical protein